MALWLGIALFVLPVLLVAVVYVPVRLRYARRSASARRLARTHPEILALRALAHRPLRLVTRACPDPVGGWRDGDPVAVRALADLELASLGLRRDVPGGAPAPRAPVRT